MESTTRYAAMTLAALVLAAGALTLGCPPKPAAEAEPSADKGAAPAAAPAADEAKAKAPDEAPAKGTEEAPPELTKLRLGLAIPSWLHAVAWVTEDAGIFDKHGLDVTVFLMKGSAGSMQGLLSGDIDIALAGSDAMIKADLAGGDMVAFGGLANHHYHQIVTTADITTPEKLKGKSIGLPVLGGPQDTAVKVALKRFGLKYNEDVIIKNMGSEYARLVALKKGEVDAVTSAATRSLVDKMGFHVLADIPAWNIPFPYMQMIARRGFLADNEDTALRFVRAISEGIRYYKTHRDESLAIVAKYLGGKADEPGEAYDSRGPSLISYPPYPDMAGYEAYLADLVAQDPRAAERTAGEFVTTELLDKVKAEGGFEAAP